MPIVIKALVLTMVRGKEPLGRGLTGRLYFRREREKKRAGEAGREERQML
jgi:hypothetical protein